MTSQQATIHKRVNVTLPIATLRLLDRVAKKGNRSGFVDRAVRFYVEEVGRANLTRQLQEGSVVRGERDLTVAEDWFFVDESAWRKMEK